MLDIAHPSTLIVPLTTALIEDAQPLFGTDDAPGLFDDSLAVLEVTSALMSEFDLDASVFNESSFATVESLSETIYQETLLSTSN